MQILQKACGDYATNCYIIETKEGQIIVDPGFNAFEFVREKATKPLAILNTHGHFDHVWDNARLQKEFNIPLYIHKDDEFMLQDPFNMGHEPSRADFLVQDEKELEIGGAKIRFLLYPGHTPGCCMIDFVGENCMFSGDFLFKRSIGRYDFPYSNANDMKKSLEKVLLLENDKILYPGHGEATSLKAEQENIPFWLRYF